MGDSEGRVVIEGDHHGSDDARGASDAAQQRGIPPSLYDDLVHYLKYASSAYVPLCPRPNGKTLVTQFSNPITDIIGFVARNDGHRELIVSIRGSLSVTNFLEDSQIVLVPWLAPGISATHGARVHSGFLLAWNSIVVQILAIISEQLLLYPGYAIIATGHSLGGAVATLAAASLQGKFPENQVRLYSYGAPRVGNQVFAQRFNEEFGTRAYRVVHENDGVPTMISTCLGYHHHGIEYWQKDPPIKERVVVCSKDGEDPNCSASIPSKGINPAHLLYFGITIPTPFCI